MSYRSDGKKKQWQKPSETKTQNREELENLDSPNKEERKKNLWKKFESNFSDRNLSRFISTFIASLRLLF